jgi:hypothetical protein
VNVPAARADAPDADRSLTRPSMPSRRKGVGDEGDVPWQPATTASARINPTNLIAAADAEGANGGSRVSASRTRSSGARSSSQRSSSSSLLPSKGIAEIVPLLSNVSSALLHQFSGLNLERRYRGAAWPDHTVRGRGLFQQRCVYRLVYSLAKGHGAARASVGATRAARRAGRMPATAPTASVAVMPPASTHAGTTVGQPCSVA